MVRSRIRGILKNNFYDSAMLILIILNTVILCLNGIVNTSSTEFQKLNLFMVVCFGVDVVLKLVAYDLLFFKDILNILSLVTFIVNIV